MCPAEAPRPSGPSDVPASPNQRGRSVVTGRASTTLIRRAAASIVAGRVGLGALSEGARSAFVRDALQSREVDRSGTNADPAPRRGARSRVLWRVCKPGLERTCRLKRFWIPLFHRYATRHGPKYRLRGHSRPIATIGTSSGSHRRNECRTLPRSLHFGSGNGNGNGYEHGHATRTRARTRHGHGH